MPFKSEAQRRFLWKNHPEIARRWAKEYGSKMPQSEIPDDKEYTVAVSPDDKKMPPFMKGRHNPAEMKKREISSEAAKRRLAMMKSQKKPGK